QQHARDRIGGEPPRHRRPVGRLEGRQRRPHVVYRPTCLQESRGGLPWLLEADVGEVVRELVLFAGIWQRPAPPIPAGVGSGGSRGGSLAQLHDHLLLRGRQLARSEERRVGKECRSGWSPADEKKNARRRTK